MQFNVRLMIICGRFIVSVRGMSTIEFVRLQVPGKPHLGEEIGKIFKIGAYRIIMY